MRCILHIGTGKTGTTYLQHFLALNRRRLLANGCIFPCAAGTTNNYALAVAAYDRKKRDHFTEMFGIDDDQALIAFQQKSVAAISAEIAQCRKKIGGAPKLLFSSEHFQSRLHSVDEIGRLREIILGFGVTEISVIVYLRRPADIACSLYSTAIVTGSTLDRPPPPEDRHWRVVCDHRTTLERFGAVFGTGSITPRLFAADELVNGSIVDDFLQASAISVDGYELPVESNESLSALGLEVLRQINQRHSVNYADGPQPCREKIVELIRECFIGPKYMMPRACYGQYDRAFADSDEWVRRTYFPGRERLFGCRVPEPAALPDTGVLRGQIEAFRKRVSEGGLLRCLYDKRCSGAAHGPAGGHMGDAR